MPHRASNPRAGFTLLELVLVMFLAALVLAMVAPSLSGWSRGARIRDAADQFVATTRLAQTRAIEKGVAYRINIDASAGTYQLRMQNGADFTAVQSAEGRTFQLPDGLKLQLASATGGAAPQPYIDFFPTGRLQPMQVKITSDRGDAITIDCPSPAEGFVIARSTGGAR